MALAVGQKVSSAWWADSASFTVTQLFGTLEQLVVNGVQINQPHSGIDIGMPVGTKLVTPAHAVVDAAGTDKFGNRFVALKMDDGAVVKLLHLDTVAVSAGQDLSPGALLGTSGDSGLSTGPHLHFEVDRSGAPVDPTSWLQALATAAGPAAHGDAQGGIPNPLDSLSAVNDFFKFWDSLLKPYNLYKVLFVATGVALIGTGVFLYFFKEEAAAAGSAARTAGEVGVLAA